MFKAGNIVSNEQIKKSLIKTARGIANTFGLYCGTVIYEVKDNNSIVVESSHNKVTGEAVGDAYEDFLDKIENESMDRLKESFASARDVENIRVNMNNGKNLKHTMIHYIGEGYHYALAINFDNTVLLMAESALKDFNTTQEEDTSVDSEMKMLEGIFDSCHLAMGKPIYMMDKKDRVELVRLLREKDAFTFHKSIPYVAAQLKVSRYTIYNYLDEIEKKNK